MFKQPKILSSRNFDVCLQTGEDDENQNSIDNFAKYLSNSLLLPNGVLCVEKTDNPNWLHVTTDPFYSSGDVKEIASFLQILYVGYKTIFCDPFFWFGNKGGGK